MICVDVARTSLREAALRQSSVTTQTPSGLVTGSRPVRSPFENILDISDNECRDAKFRVSTRVMDNAYLISGDVYYKQFKI